MKNLHSTVDIPSGTYKQKRSSGVAVYQYTSHYRNKDGKPRHKSIMIGMIDSDSGKLVPNENYYIHNNIHFPSSPFNLFMTMDILFLSILFAKVLDLLKYLKILLMTGAVYLLPLLIFLAREW